jgi:polyferredoxin
MSVPLSAQQVVWLSVLATAGLALMWAVFWWRVGSQTGIYDILQSSGFFRTIAVMGVIAATVVLSLAGRLEGNITGAILSGIVGYVLGHLASHGEKEEVARK